MFVLKIDVRYNKYNTIIEETTIVFDDGNSIKYEYVEEVVGEVTTKKIKTTTKDTLGTEISTEMNKTEMSEALFLIRTLFNQLP